MNRPDIVAESTKNLIEELRSGPSTNVMKVCEDYFDLWENELFPLLRAQNKSCYRAVVEILTLADYKNVKESNIRNYFFKIRAKREGGGNVLRSYPLTQARPSTHMTNPVVATSVPGAAPIDRSAEVKPPVAVNLVASPSKFALPPPDAEEFNIVMELERLNEESKGDFQEEISPRDVQLLHYFDGIRKTYPLMQTMINGDGAKMAGDMMDVNVKDLFSTIKMKFRARGVKFEV